MGRPRVRRERAAVALAVLLTAAGVAACGATDDPGRSATASTVPAQELFATHATAIGDQLWVFGGIAGPDGSTPPVTGVTPPGWGPNLAVTVYAPDGEVVRRTSLRADIQDVVAGGRILRVGDIYYLVGNLCGSFACGQRVEPLLVRLSDDNAVRIPLDLPPADYGDVVGAGFLSVVGQSRSTAWVLQQVADPTGTAYVEPQRLLAIDLASGRAMAVALPTGLYGTEVLCLGGDHLFAAQAELDERANLAAVQILRRPASFELADWEVLTELSVTLGYVGGGQLQCIDEHDELMLSLDATPTEVTTLSMTTGDRSGAHTMTDSSGARFLGLVGGNAVVMSQAETGARILWLHQPGSWKRLQDPYVRQDAALVVLDGQLYDMQHVLKASQPGAGRLVPVDI